MQQCNHTYVLHKTKQWSTNNTYIEALIIMIYYIITSVEYQYLSVAKLTSSTARVPSASPANTAEPTEEGWRHNTLSWRCRHHNFSLQHIYIVMEVLTPQLLPTTHLYCHGGVDTTTTPYNTFTLSWRCQHHNSPLPYIYTVMNVLTPQVLPTTH